MRISQLVATAILAVSPSFSAHAGGASGADQEESLKDIIVAMDAKLFDAFNNCDLDAWKLYLAEDIEFYQDNDDVTTTREELTPSFLDRCDADGRAKLQRELVTETVEVHPMQGYGAVQFGSHNFWIMDGDKRAEMVATPKFVHLWRHKDGAWQITRVISYSH